MGSSCGKDNTTIQQRKDSNLRKDIVNQYVDTASIADAFTISLESFVTTTNRISAKRTPLTKGCKSVVVTKISLNVNQQVSRVANTFGLHMPVLKLSNTDVKFQLPELLPLNLWGGTQTIYSFVFPDVADNSCVTLTGKVGTKPISIKQLIDKGQTFTSEELIQHGKDIEAEMRRYEKNKTKTKKDSTAAEARQSNSDSTGRNSGRKGSSGRSSVATPYSGITYAGDSTDSDTTSARQRAREKRPKCRRKDTPSQQSLSLGQRRALNYAKVKLYKQQQEEGCVPEETESPDIDDEDLRSEEEVSRRRKSSQGGKLWTPGHAGAGRLVGGAGLVNLQMPARLTRSFNNITELTDEPPVAAANMDLRSPQSWSGQPALARRKKRSIGSKLAGQVRSSGDAGSESPDKELPLPPVRQTDHTLAEAHDIDNDADDEDENAAKQACIDAALLSDAADKTKGEHVDDKGSSTQERVNKSDKHENDFRTSKVSMKNFLEVDTNDGASPVNNRASKRTGIGKGIGKKSSKNDSRQNEVRLSLDHGSVSNSSANNQVSPASGEHSSLQTASKITLRVKEAEFKAESDGNSHASSIHHDQLLHVETDSTLASSKMHDTCMSQKSLKCVDAEKDTASKQKESNCQIPRTNKDDLGSIDMEKDINSPSPRMERSSTLSGREFPRKALRMTLSMDEISEGKETSPGGKDKKRPSPVHAFTEHALVEAIDERPSPVQSFEENRATDTSDTRQSPVTAFKY